MSTLVAAAGVDAGDTAWMLAATALVLLMTPALGLFYAGLVRSKNTLNTFMMCVGAIAVATVTWALVGYSLAFDGDAKIIGGLQHALLNGVGFEPRDGTTIPHLVFFAFQATFCIITTALVSGAVVERMRFGPFLIFAALWSVLVYAVLAHWAFGGGWLAAQGTLDFAGGVPVEMGSGFSALAAALVVGARKDYGRQALLPHNAMYVLIGAGLLWFGWFGFNGGSGFNAGSASVLAFTNTLLTPACTLLTWFLLD
ncbi:MAG: ammonium transporter, partial [Solirubrobacteraceae bacterium]